VQLLHISKDKDILFVLAPGNQAIQVLDIRKPVDVQISQEYLPGSGVAVPLARNMVGLANYVIPWSNFYRWDYGK